MDPDMSVLFMLTISFPEAMLLSYLTIQFIGKKPILVEIVLMGLMQMVIAYMVRHLAIPVGLHTILLMCSTILIVFVISRLPLWSIAAGFIAIFILYAIIEITTTQLLLIMTGLTIQEVINHPYMRIMFFIPNAGVLLCFIIIFKKYTITFYRIAKWGTIHGDYEREREIRHNVLLKQQIPALILLLLPVLLLYILNFTYISVRLEDYSGHNLKVIKVLINALIVLWGLLSFWAMIKINKSILKEQEAKRNAEIIGQLEQLARTDELTGLFNRRSLMEQLNIEVKRAQRYNRPLSLIILDLDKFKEINDNYGHIMGDRVLKEVSKITMQCTRSVDVVGRYGGDEFVIVMPDTTLEGAKKIGVRIQNAIQNTCLLEGGNVLLRLAISMGAGEMIEFNQEGDPAQRLLEMADDDLYKAKGLFS